MATYRYQCVSCGTETEFWQSMKDDPLRVHHELPGEDACDGALVKVLGPVRTVRIGVHGQKTRQVDRTERDWSKDMAAYRRLRMEGKQPLRIDGAARMEHEALGNFHLETGMPYTDAQAFEGREEARAIIREASEGTK